MMYIRIGYELMFDVPAPSAIMLMLHVQPDQARHLQKPEWIQIDPGHLQMETFIDSFGNRAGRMFAPAGKLTLKYDNIIADSGLHEPKINGERLHPINELPTECLQFLLASRYCEVDRLSQMAWDLFGKTPETWERVQAVMDWVHNHIEFGYKFASPTKTAFDACNEKRGVCRDYQHLAITMLRALNIPARYATGYLGDIGVPQVPLPMDFSAWFEVYLGNKWITLDGRHNKPRIGRVLMARGRDATDVALTTSFGPMKLAKFKVWTDEVAEAATPQMQQKVEVSTLVTPPTVVA